MSRTIAIHKQVLDKIKHQIKHTISMAENIQTPIETTISMLSQLLESVDKYSNGKPEGKHVEVEQKLLRRWVEDLKDLAFKGESLVDIIDEIFEDVRDREDDFNLYLGD